MPPKETTLIEYENQNDYGGEFSFEIRARKRNNGLFTLYVWWTHNFRFEEGIPLTTERTRWNKNIRTPQQFIEGLDDCLDHLRDFNFEGNATEEHVIEQFLPELRDLDEAFAMRVKSYLEKPRMKGNCPKVLGDWSLYFSMYNWETAESFPLNGVLSISFNLELAPEPLFFLFSGIFTVSDQDTESFSIESETWAGFLEACENCEYGTIPKDLIESEVRRIPQINGYLNWLSEASPAAVDYKPDWYYTKPAQRLIAKGVSLPLVSEEEVWKLQKHAEAELVSGNVENVEDFLALGVKPAPAWWEILVKSRNLEALVRLSIPLGVNAEIKKYRWKEVYDQETPLTLCAKAAWKEGIDFLLKAGAETDLIVSSKSFSGIHYHDLSQYRTDREDPQKPKT